MAPREIQAFVDQHRPGLLAAAGGGAAGAGASGGARGSGRFAAPAAALADDPYDGMSPEEIDAYVAKHGLAK